MGKNEEDTKTSSWARGSAWNPGNTYESRDYSAWARQRFSELVVGLEFDGFEIEVVKVKTATIDASIDISRGRRRVLYDISFVLKWKGRVDGRYVSGEVEMYDITPGEEEQVWFFDVTGNSSDEDHARAIQVVTNGRDLIVDVINLLLQELDRKK